VIVTPLRRLAPAAALFVALAAPALAQDPLHSIDVRGGSLVTLADGSTVVRCATTDQTDAERAAADAAVARYFAGGEIGRRYMVPVAVHIVARTNGVGLVPFNQVVAQIEVMNEAYQGTPFEFYLFDVDTTLNDTWHLTEGGATELAMVNALSIRPTEVLNLYLRNPGAGLLGYAYFPSTPGAQWASHNLYSSVPGGTAAPYNLGATAVHEVGHNLGLAHTFSGGCGSGGGGGDGVLDTSPEASEAFGCPQTRDTCPADLGRDPIRNFMDYTDDACMFEFTPGQAVRAAAQIAAFKPDLGESGQPNDVQIDGIASPLAGRNPAGAITPELVIRNLGSAALTSAQIAWEVRQGAVVVASGASPWSGSLAHQATADVTLPPINLAPGAYRLHLASRLAGGTLDAQPENDTLSVGFALVEPVAGIDVDWEAPEDAFAWNRTNPIGYVRNWGIRQNVVGPNGAPSRVAAVRHWDFRIPGTEFFLVAPPVVVPPVGRLELSFDLAYAPRSGRPQPFSVRVSTDGGATFETAREWTDEEVATQPAQNTSYQPSAAAHWQTFTVSLAPWAPAAGEPNDEVLIAFVSGDSDGNNRYLENVVLDMGDAQLVLDGEEGWRLISAPTSNVTIDDLMGTIWTQGFPGSDAPAAPDPNVFYYDETADGPVDGNTPPTSQSALMGDGRGWLVYVYSDDDQDGTPEGFPKVLTSSGGAPAGPVALPTTYTPSTVALPHVDGWNLVGNPYPDPIDWSEVARTNVTDNVYVYDATFGGTGQYRVWNGAVGNLPGGLIPLGNGFWTKAHAAGPSISVPSSARVPNGLPATPDATALTLRLTGNVGGPELATEAFLAFDDAGTEGFDLLDAYTFTPLSFDYLLLASRPASGEVRSSIDVRPMPAEGTATVYTVDVAAVAGSTPTSASVTLTWPDISDLPGDLGVSLVDNETSATVDMRAQSSYTFTTAPTAAVTAGGVPSILSAGGDGRLTITVQRSGVATEGGPTSAFGLRAAAPNPFASSTLITYSLDAPADVRLALYDVLGREVATIEEGERAAGTHSVTLRGSGLRAGVYVVRLEAGERGATMRIVRG
jgi:hypothetical protein